MRPSRASRPVPPPCAIDSMASTVVHRRGVVDTGSSAVSCQALTSIERKAAECLRAAELRVNGKLPGRERGRGCSLACRGAVWRDLASVGSVLPCQCAFRRDLLVRVRPLLCGRTLFFHRSPVKLRREGWGVRLAPASAAARRGSRLDVAVHALVGPRRRPRFRARAPRLGNALVSVAALAWLPSTEDHAFGWGRSTACGASGLACQPQSSRVPTPRLGVLGSARRASASV